MIKFSQNYVEILFKNHKVVFQDQDTRVVKVYDGPLDGEPEFRDHVWGEDIHHSTFEPISSYGHIDYREALVYCCDEDNFFTNRFLKTEWKSYKGLVQDPAFPHSKNKTDILEIVYQNDQKTIQINQYFAIYEDVDTYVSWIKITNIGTGKIHVKRAMSLQLDLPGNDYEVTTFTGKWAYERHITKNTINKGVFKNSSICGASSSFNNPSIIVSKENSYYLLNFIYSSNHQELIENDHNNTTRALIGMNDFMMDVTLEKGEEFETPEAVLTYGTSFNDVKIKSNRFIENNILPKSKETFPMVFNSWEAVDFKINKNNWKKLADLAAQVNADVFVFDDGWFGHRMNEHSSLGDWYLNVEKMGTFDEIKDYLNAKKLGFGLWVEPEMVSPDSDLYRAHPEFVLELPGVNPVLGRCQLMLDMANPECVDYIFKTLSDLIDEAQPKYIKWDFNRLVTEVYCRKTHGGRFFYDYQIGLYKLMYQLLTKYPEITFEGCASGGARFDLGILSYFPVIWTSDDTDAKERIFIQEGTNMVYPMSTMSNHVSISPNLTTKVKSSIEDRINITLFGRYGYELDLTKCPKSDVSTLKKASAYYRKHKDLILNGDCYYSFTNEENIKALTVVNEDKSEAIACAISLSKNGTKIVKFEGLNPDYIYELRFRPQTNTDGEIFPPLSGKTLMEKGITISHFFMENDPEENEIGISSRTIHFIKVN